LPISQAPISMFLLDCNHSLSPHTPIASTYSSLLTFFFTATATTEIYTLSLHDALPILMAPALYVVGRYGESLHYANENIEYQERSEEHTSELQSRGHLVCRLLLEKKKIVLKSWRRTAYSVSPIIYSDMVSSPVACQP